MKSERAFRAGAGKEPGFKRILRHKKGRVPARPNDKGAPHVRGVFHPDPPPFCVERVHDLRVVRPAQISGRAVVAGGRGKLGHRVL